MEAASALKAVEALGVLAAGGLFAWWQFRDLRREKTKTQAKRGTPTPPQDVQENKDAAP